MRKRLKISLHRYWRSLVWIPVLIFSLLELPFQGVVPYLDGHVEFNVAYNFYAGKYLSNWIPYHPPLKPILSSIIFLLFGFPAYTSLGLLLGIVGIISLYTIALKLFDKKTAVISSILLSLSGLYVSTALFSLNDFIMTVFILLAFAFYVRKHFILYAIAASMAVGVKETAIIFPFCLTVVELTQRKLRIEHIVPLLILCDWLLFLRITHHSLWNAWNFSDTPRKGIIYTFFHNFVTFKIFNDYAFGNWIHLFILNFNWILWLLAIPALLKSKKTQYTFAILLFIIVFSTVVLSFQTFTITRYVLPLLPFLYLFVADFIVHQRFAKVAVLFVLLVMVVSLFTSVDPVSNKILKRTTVLNTKYYARRHDGGDAITYNMQFLFMVKRRDGILRSGDYKKPIHGLLLNRRTLSIYDIPTK